MATKKDLVEAYSFSRRRLVTAFVSGAPGGREVEPARPGRTIVGGLALAVLLVAGAAIAGVFTSRSDVDWTQPGLVVSKERGAMYVIIEASDDPELRPVINRTSAQLILGADLPPEIVPQEDIEQQQVSDPIGILGAPADVPDPERLIQTGWTACTADGYGSTLVVDPAPEITPTPTVGYTVTNADGDVFVLAESRATASEPARAYAYPVPRRGGRDSLLSALGLPITDAAVEVSDEWLRLFPVGTPLELGSFGIADLGEPAPAGDWDPGAEVGDWFEVDGATFVLTDEGAAPLGEFEAAVYRALAAGETREQRVELVPGDQEDLGLDATRWPAVLPAQGGTEMCALLEAEHDEKPRVLLAGEPGTTASAIEQEVPTGRFEVGLAFGHGSYVRSAGWESVDGGRPFLLTALPQRHELVGAQVAENLGYADVRAPLVPDTWVQLFADGVPLSLDAALCPPAADAPTGSECA